MKYSNFDQSEIWGSFRVARQAQTDYEIISQSNKNLKAIGRVSGFDFNNNIMHQREFNCSDTKLSIKDILISSTKADDSKIFYHFTPEYSIKNNQIFNNKTESIIANIFCNMKWEVVKTEYYKEFGQLSFKDTLIINSIPCNTEVKFEIQFYE